MATIVVRRINQGGLGEGEQLVRNRIVLLARIAAGEIGAPSAVNQQAIAGENPVLGIEAYRVGGMAGRV